MPYIGFFNKISKADVFVVVDNVQFNRKSWQQRTLIKCNNAPLFLTIPVLKKGRGDQSINDVEIIDDGWRNKHWKSLFLSYHKTPYFGLYQKELEDFYNHEWKRLSDFTIAMTMFLIDAIGIKFHETCIGSELGITGEKTNLLVDICQRTGCDTYLSGAGARDYVEEDILRGAGLSHIFNEFMPIRYNQYGREFLDGMAIIDAMFMYGPKTLELIKGGGAVGAVNE
jgi:hypothetical protein